MRYKYLFYIIIFFFGCQKQESDNNSNDENLIYANLNIDGNKYSLIENEGAIKAGYGGHLSPDSYSMSGSVYNSETIIGEDMYSFSTNSFSITFHNILPEDIQTGIYDFYLFNSADTVRQGVSVKWIDSESWSDLMSKYRLTQEYKDCMSEYNNYEICEIYTRGSQDFYLSSNLTQPTNSQFEIKSLKTRSYEHWNPDCNPEEFNIEELIIEGSVRCEIMSRFDSINTRFIEADFRLHIPDIFKRVNCPGN